MTPFRGNPFLLLSSSPSRTLEGLFELTWRLLRALKSPCRLLPSFCYKEARILSGVPRLERRSQDIVKNNWCKPWFFAFVENALNSIFWKLGGPGAPFKSPPGHRHKWKLSSSCSSWNMKWRFVQEHQQLWKKEKLLLTKAGASQTGATNSCNQYSLSLSHILCAQWQLIKLMDKF